MKIQSQAANKLYGFEMCIFGDIILKCEEMDCQNFEFVWLYL